MAADDPFERRLGAALHELLDATPPPHPTWAAAPAAIRNAGRPVMTSRFGRGGLWLLAAATVAAVLGSALLVAGGRLPIGPRVSAPAAIASESPTMTATSPVNLSPSPTGCATSATLAIIPTGIYPGPTAVNGVSVGDGPTPTIAFHAVSPSPMWFGVEVTIESALPPFTRDPSDLPVTVEGESFIQITLRGVEGSRLPPPALDQRFKGSLITELVETGDFEGVQTWIVGLTRPVCVGIYGGLGEPSVTVALSDPEPALVSSPAPVASSR